MLNMKNTKKSLTKGWMTTELKQNLLTDMSKRKNLIGDPIPTNQIAKILKVSKKKDPPPVPVNTEKEASHLKNIADLRIDVNIKRTDGQEVDLKREVLVEKVKRSRDVAVRLVMVIAVEKKEDIDVGLSIINGV